MKQIKLNIIVSIVIFCFVNCSNKKKANPNPTHEISLSKTDSTVVSNLIKQSNTFYEQNLISAPVLDDYLIQAQEIAQKNNFLEQQALIYSTLGVRYRNRSEFNNALELHEKAVEIARSLNNKPLITKYLNLLAVVYRRMDENKNALDLHLEAMNIAESIHDTFQMAVSINGLGNVYTNLQRYHVSIEYFKKSLEISKQQNNKLGLAINYNNIGESVKSLGLIDSALVYFNKSFEYNTQINSIGGKAINYNSIGDAYKLKKQFNTAINYLEQALVFNKQSRDKINISVSYTILGETYLLTKDYFKGIKNLENGLKIAMEVGSKNQIEACSRLLSGAYEALNNNKKALDFLKTAEIYKDSIINEENLRHLVAVEASQNLEQTQNQIQFLNNKTELQNKLIAVQKKTLLFTFILAFVLIIVVVLSFRQLKLRSKYNNILMQQRLLRTQMNPHFIFNALSAIQVYILENDMKKSSQFLSDFASLMRQVLRSSEYEYVPLKDENKMLGYYLELQRLRFVYPFQYNIHIDENINEDDVLIPPMLTQPFVENSIEHGIKSIGDKGIINIRFFKQNSTLKIEIEDNGIGWKASQKAGAIGSKHESMAIKITNERLDVIKKMTHKKAHFKITDIQDIKPSESGVLVQFELPIISIAEKNRLNKK
ncbi:tetratricopeptide repeat-containing sensor histidine kinase [Plebeiibacterium sediminum]|uniref:Tetratricopeptide repeat protein n=1 Tax=Plebeiibacterium sediminum TaxID=2992112 RepID=A0AAE3M8G6_9BACT|nr:tetratricopeptide repeat protein [Plebeiobacterium sediminum]MCW3788750.1 tetratricopeptide repeat protein [Plebeiobacterium sediminum]